MIGEPIVNEESYRRPASRTQPKTRFEARAQAMARDWYAVLLVMAPCLIVPLALLPSSVDVSCTARGASCEVRVDRLVIGTKSEHLDMRGATGVDFERRGKTTSIAVDSKTTGHHTYGFDNGIGGSQLVLDALRTFVARPDADLSATHDGRLFLTIALLAWSAITGGFLLSAFSRLRVQAESDGVHLSMRVSQFPYRTRTITVDLAEVVGVTMSPILRRRKNGQVTSSRSHIRLKMKGEAEDIFLHGVHTHPAVTAMSEALDRFVRKEVDALS